MMQLKSLPHTWLRSIARPRSAALVLLAAIGMAALGARCIERTSTYVDQDGYTHIVGQMVNDTDIQGTQIMLQGTLFDANNNIVAQKTAPTCPPDTQPHQQTTFDIRFDNPGIPAWTRYDVRPISGITLTQPLPDPHVVALLSDAARFTSPLILPGLTVTPNDVFLTFRLRNQSSNTYSGVQGCAAVFDQQGKVVFVSSSEIIEENNGLIGPATLHPQELVDVFMSARNVPKGPVQVRAWLWFGPKGAPTSAYQFVTTGMITIQNIAP
ncbi:MAG TPA: hypothetical protein VFC53_04760 [Dehalococcoidia bacterium]|nr:hypothetical protein [Dehalococcoidia bacterium]